MKKKIIQSFAILAVIGAGQGCSDEIIQQIIAEGGPRQGIVVVSSDFIDTVVSLIDRVGRETAVSAFASSGGSAGLSSPLSGDVVPIRHPSPAGDVILLDRTNANVTIIDPTTASARGQFSVRTNPADSNPNATDVLVYSSQKMYVARQGRCVHASSMDPFGFCEVVAGAPNAFDTVNSNDVVAMNPVTGAITEIPALDFTVQFGAGGVGNGEIDSDNDDLARPAWLQQVGPYVAVVLRNLDAFFDGTSGVGLVALFDPETDTLVDAMPETTGTNPIVLSGEATDCIGPGRGAAYNESTRTLFIACEGTTPASRNAMDGDHAQQVAGSRLMRVELGPLFDSNLNPVVTEIADVDDLYPEAVDTTEQSAFSGLVQLVSPTLGFIHVSGKTHPFVGSDNTSPPPGNGVPSAVFTFNPTTGAVNGTSLLETTCGFDIPELGMLADVFTRTLYVAESSPFCSTITVIHVFDFDPGYDGGAALSGGDPEIVEDEDAALVPSTLPGIAPRELAFY